MSKLIWWHSLFGSDADMNGFANQRMFIDKDHEHVGIGLNFTPGNDALDILLDVNFPRTGYGINNQTVLHNYGTRSISVGVGQSIIFGGIENTNVGYNAGNAITTGRENTLVGIMQRNLLLTEIGIPM